MNFQQRDGERDLPGEQILHGHHVFRSGVGLHGHGMTGMRTLVGFLFSTRASADIPDLAPESGVGEQLAELNGFSPTVEALPHLLSRKAPVRVQGAPGRCGRDSGWTVTRDSASGPAPTNSPASARRPARSGEPCLRSKPTAAGAATAFCCFAAAVGGQRRLPGLTGNRGLSCPCSSAILITLLVLFFPALILLLGFLVLLNRALRRNFVVPGLAPRFRLGTLPLDVALPLQVLLTLRL